MCAQFSLTVQDGASPVFIASKKGHTDVVDVLVNAEADVDQAISVVYSYVLTMEQNSRSRLIMLSYACICI